MSEDMSVPVPDPTERTVEALRRDLHAQRELIETHIAAIMTLLDERDRRYTEHFIDNERAVESAFAASEKAILKAEVSIEKRADSTYASLARVQEMLGEVMSRKEADQRIADLLERIQSLSNRITVVEARKAGAGEERSGMQSSTQLWLAIGGFVLIVLTFLAARGGL